MEKVAFSAEFIHRSLVIMASQESLLPRPSDKPSLNVCKLLVLVTLVAVSFFLIKDDPECDQPLVFGGIWVIWTCIAGVVQELLKQVSGWNVERSVMVIVSLNNTVLWAWGHWPVYRSQTCDDTLWYFAFVAMLLADIFAGVLVVVICLMVRLRMRRDS